MTDNNEMPTHHGIEETLDRKYPNQTLKLLIERASCRSFSERKVPPEVMQLILEAGIHAATGGNLQPYSIIKSERREVAAKLAALVGNQDWVANAPVNLLFCIDWHRIERWAMLEIAPFSGKDSFRHFWISFQDTVIAAQNICTAADSLGLGSVYIGTVLECFRELRDMFQLPKGVFPVVLLSMGYPKTRPLPRKKLGVPIIVHDEKYHDPDDRTLVDAFNNKYPDLKIEINEERLARIADVCRKIHGEEFAAKCLERIKNTGYINAVQRYFGLHYSADAMPDGNEEFLQIFEEFGFGWFKKYIASGKNH